MINLGMILEWYRYNGWAWEKLLERCAGLPDGQLDQPFEMGPGTLRATFRHLYGAERVWAERVQMPACEALPKSSEVASVAEISTAVRALGVARWGWLGGLSAEQLARPIKYTNFAGETYTNALADILVHVCNHGIHHRAQALNMLRHTADKAGGLSIDYIFMKVEQGGQTPPDLTVEALREYFAYGDWARKRVHAVAGGLTDEQLDRRFDIGGGSVRHTLLHIRNAEQWWLENWTRGGGQFFPSDEEGLPVAEIGRRFDQTVSQRDEFFGGLTDADLRRTVSATPRPNVVRTFPLGVTMLQLCCHGTHHRAQALNMLRHVGVEVPALDYVARLRSH